MGSTGENRVGSQENRMLLQGLNYAEKCELAYVTLHSKHCQQVTMPEIVG